MDNYNDVRDVPVRLLIIIHLPKLCQDIVAYSECTLS